MGGDRLWHGLLLLLCAVPSSADIATGREFHIKSKDHFDHVWSFEYAPGGFLDMEITLQPTASALKQNNSIQFLLCTDSGIAPLRNAQLKDVCVSEHFQYPGVHCDWQRNMGGGYNMVERFDIETEGFTKEWYHLLHLNCHEGEYSLMLDYRAVNPGGEYLSLSEVPFKVLYQVTFVAWLVLVVLWCYNWWRYRWFNIDLQRFLTLVPLLNVCSSLAWLQYWKHKSVVGVEPVFAGWVCFVLVCVSRGMCFACFLLIGKGWGITKGTLTKVEYRKIWATTILLMVAHGIYYQFGSFLLFFLVVLEVLVLRFVFASIVRNSVALMTQLHLLRRLEVVHTTTPVWQKLQMFKRFQVAMVIFISIDVIFHLWATIFLRESVPWVEHMMDHIVTALMSLGVGFTLRMRPFPPHFYRVLPAGTALNNDALPGAQLPPDASPEMVEAAQWRGGAKWVPGVKRPCVLDMKPNWNFPTADLPILLLELPVPQDENGQDTCAPTVVVATPADDCVPQFIGPTSKEVEDSDEGQDKEDVDGMIPLATLASSASPDSPIQVDAVVDDGEDADADADADASVPDADKDNDEPPGGVWGNSGTAYTRLR